MVTLHQYVRKAARMHPERVAVRCGTEELDYATLDSLSDRIARGLQGRGTAPGDRVVVQLPKSPNAVAAWLGVLKAGAAYIPIDASAPPARVEAIRQRARPRAVVVAMNDTQGPTSISVDQLLREESEGTPPAASSDDPAWIHFTSGSTGAPKGAVLTHGAADAYLTACDDLVSPGSEEVIANHAPLSFDLASFDVHFAIRRSATLTMIPEGAALAPGSVLRFLEEERPTLLYTVPTTLSRLASLRTIRSYRFPSLRHLLFAGEPPVVPHLRELREVFPNATFHHWYGSTEAPLVMALAFPPRTPLPDPLPLGRHIPGLELALRDSSEGGGLVPPAPGGEGELLIRGTPLLSGYCGSEDDDAQGFYEGTTGHRWFRTRDVIRLDDEGLAYYVARADRMVKVGGRRVDPAEVEAVGVRCGGVRQCVAVAVADERRGTRLYMLYCGDASAGDLHTHLREQLPRYMVPDRCLAVPTLPTTASGKLDRSAVEQQLRSMA